MEISDITTEGLCEVTLYECTNEDCKEQEYIPPESYDDARCSICYSKMVPVKIE